MVREIRYAEHEQADELCGKENMFIFEEQPARRQLPEQTLDHHAQMNHYHCFQK